MPHLKHKNQGTSYPGAKPRVSETVDTNYVERKVAKLVGRPLYVSYIGRMGNPSLRNCAAWPYKAKLRRRSETKKTMPGTDMKPSLRWHLDGRVVGGQVNRPSI